MTIQQPLATNKLNSPSHSLSHRVFANDNAAPAQAIVVDSAGRVGIGTTEPGAKLHVVGAATILQDDNARLSFRNAAGTERLYLAFTGTGVTTFDADNDITISPNNGASGSMVLKASGNVGIGTTAPTAKLDVNSDIIRLRTAKTPASAGAAGNAGDICWDASYVYVCVATNTWKRSAIATW